jgi:hypothetical protein
LDDTDTSPRWSPAADVALVAFVVAGSLAPYVNRLGFYGDDWDVLSVFSLSADQSLRGLYAAMAVEAQLLMRPGQKLLAALLYQTFGLDPLGYHVVNASLLVASAVLLLMVLRELGLSRAVAVAAAIIYSVLPHYSTARVWWASIQAPFSMAGYLLSLYAGLRSVRTSPTRAYGWQALSLASLVASALAYEVAMPLFFLNPLLFWHRQRQLQRPSDEALSPPAFRVFMGLTLAAVLGTAAFKAGTSTRLSGGPSLFYLAVAGREIARINLWTYGLAAPRTLLIAIRHASAAVLLVAALLGLVSYWFLRRLPLAPTGLGVRPRPWLRLMIAGAAVFLLGHLIFLATNVGFSATGANNRTAVVGASGIALVLVAAAAWLTERVPAPWRVRCFAGLIALISVAAFAINAMLVRSWVTAYEREEQVLYSIRQAFATLPASSSLILDGVCRYVGPAIVFESSWDLQGALRLFYRDSTLRADVVSPDLRVDRDGVHTVIYGDDSRYPYDMHLIVFDAGRGISQLLPDETAARTYFARSNHDVRNGCPSGRPGHGVQVF